MQDVIRELQAASQGLASEPLDLDGKHGILSTRDDRDPEGLELCLEGRKVDETVSGQWRKHATWSRSEDLAVQVNMVPFQSKRKGVLDTQYYCGSVTLYSILMLQWNQLKRFS